MDRDSSILLTSGYTQKQFFKDSFFNSIILFKNVIKDYFKYFLFNLSPISRYEFWCFSIFTAITIIIFLSVVKITSIALPFSKPYIYMVYYVYIFIIINISIRVFASRIISVKKYLNYTKTIQNQNYVLAKMEIFFEKIFLSVKLYIFIAFIKFFGFLIYFFNKNVVQSETLYAFFMFTQKDPLLYLFVFILKAITIIYIIFMVSPSLSRIEYLEDKNLEYNKISYYLTWYSKEYLVDYLTLIAIIFSVITVGYLLTIGYSISSHILMSFALLFQSVALIVSGRFFCIVIGFVSLVLFIMSVIFVFINGLEFFYNIDNAIQLVKYYQIIISLLFFGIFYYFSFERDIVKMLAILGCFLSNIFLWEDHMAFKSMMVYDNHAVPILIYGLTGLFALFIYLIRVANTKSFYKSEMQYLLSLWSDIRSTTTSIKLKYIYMVIFYASIILIVYTIIYYLYPFITGHLVRETTDAYTVKFLINIRRTVAFYMLLGLYLLFKNNNDFFSMYLTAFVVALEMYIILYYSIDNHLPIDTLYPLPYIYTCVYGLMSILSIRLSKYSKLLFLGFAFSIISFFITLLNIFTGITYMSNLILYNLLFLSLITANIITAYGSFKKIKQENIK